MNGRRFEPTLFRPYRSHEAPAPAGAFFLSFNKEKIVPRDRARPFRAVLPDRPVQPGTPLYRLLEFIAREIAKDHIDDRKPPEPERAHNSRDASAPALTEPG
jgi:hypothetical protein